MTPRDLDWEYDDERPPGENVRAMIRAADEVDADAEACKSFAFRHIPGAGPRMVELNLKRMDVEMTTYNIADFM